MITGFNLIPLLPELYLSLVALGFLMVGAFRGNGDTVAISGGAVAAVLIASSLMFVPGWRDAIVLGGMFKTDYFSGLLKTLIAAGLAASLMLSVRFLKQENLLRFEYPVLILLAGAGMMMMVSASNFLALYMALELQSLALYVLAAFSRNSTRAAEAGVKYFALGAISSGMILFGISLIYGFTGSLDYGAITASLALAPPPIGVTLGMVMVLAGIAFKISAAPFHMWTPDVYQGAPTAVTALFAIVPKIAAMGVLIRLLVGPFAALYADWVQIIWILAAASMVVGSFAAIAQSSIKRLMAYSTVANMGFALMALVAGHAAGISASLLYMMIYMIMTAGAFGVVLSMRRHGVGVEKIDDLKGLSKTHPVLAYVMAILMFSMSGIPPLAGFFGKYLVLKTALEAGFIWLAILGALASVVAAFYYLRVIKVMFFDEPADAPLDRSPSRARPVVMAISILFVLFFVIKPNYTVYRTQQAALSLFVR